MVRKDTTDNDFTDDDYTLITYQAFSRFLMLDSNKFIANYEMLFNLLEIELEETNEASYNNLLATLQTISLRSLYDCMFLMDLRVLMSPDRLITLEQSQATDDEPIYYDKFMEQITKQLFSLDSRVSALSIEGFAKLVLHQIVEDPVEYLCLLLILWHDRRLKIESPTSTQYLSFFMNVYANSRIEDIDRFQEAFQRVYQ